MTPPSGFELGDELSTLGDELDVLCSGLANLDHQAVHASCSALSLLASKLRRAALPIGQPFETKSKLHLARTLSENVFQLYGGWARVASLHGAAYTTSGDEPISGSASSLAVEG